MNRALTKKELESVQVAVVRGRPFRIGVMAKGNRQTTRTRTHISPLRPPEKDNRRQQFLKYYSYRIFFALATMPVIEAHWKTFRY